MTSCRFAIIGYMVSNVWCLSAGEWRLGAFEGKVSLAARCFARVAITDVVDDIPGVCSRVQLLLLRGEIYHEAD